MVAAAVTLPVSPVQERKKVRVDGGQSLGDVATLACGDLRLTPLLADLNPTLPSAGLLPAGTIVMCPTRDEARAFARKMDFTLGFDPKAANGTDARRRWAELQGDAPRGAGTDATAMARALLARGVTPSEAGRRIVKQCSDAQVAALLGRDDPSLRALVQTVEGQVLLPRAIARLGRVRSLLDATARPEGLRQLIEAAARDGKATRTVLDAAAVASGLRDALVEEAPRVAQRLADARSLAAIERGARDARLLEMEDAACLSALVAALGDGVEPLAGGRLELLGIAAEAQALVRHLEMLRSALRTAEDSIGRAGLVVMRAIVRGEDPSRLPRPWPLLGAVCRALSGAMQGAATAALDRGLGGLVVRSTEASTSSSRPISVSLLRARAVTCARASDEGAALAQRLAPSVVELFGLMRPVGATSASTSRTRQAREKLAFDHAVAGVRGDVRGDGIAALAVEIVERARLAGVPAASRLSKEQLAGLERVARGMAVPLAVHRRPISELGRALVVVAMAFDREFGLTLGRPTGEEAFLAAAVRQAGRVVSAAACRG